MFILPQYHTLTQIYNGINSQVYRAQHIDTHQPVILKCLKSEYPTPNQLRRYRQEYCLTRQLDCSGVVKAYGLKTYQNTLVIILEDFGGISLKKWVQQQSNSRISSSFFLTLAIQIVDSLGQLHENHVIHKDINPSNLSINPDTGVLKIIDLGIATQFSHESLPLKDPRQLEGTLPYISPEQTGRMNRVIDYRTDFYSLGVTFYQLLTGQLPFACFDPIEIVHYHIAKSPPSPRSIVPEISPLLSDILMKLMAKNAEDRYQSVRGIKADLEHCLLLLQREEIGSIKTAIIHNSYRLGCQDISEHLKIPQKLYGREQEIKLLLKVFNQFSKSNHLDSSFERLLDKNDNQVNFSPKKIVLISGYSGVGKSILVQELYKPVMENKGYFISGKFGQFQRNIPYISIVNAFTDLIHQILGESKENLEYWRKNISSSLGSNAQVIIDFIPDLELIIGPQDPVVQLGEIESQNRFNLVFKRFIEIFCHPNHPLVLVLDDLQWADSATLTLIDVILRDSSIHHLLFIGTYRSNEVSNSHPLFHCISLLKESHIAPMEIVLFPLELTHINQLVSDTLRCDRADSLPLAQLILRKTGGNPFFVNEFVNNLYTENLLKFDVKHRCWKWDMLQIESANMTDNIVDLMVRKIQKLPSKTQRILALSTCLGTEFQLETLALACDRTSQEVYADLKIAIEWGLITPLSELDEHLLIQSYTFGHDRIQQAAYTLIPEQDRSKTHAHVGTILQHQITNESQDEHIFAVVNQLNQGLDYIQTPQKRQELAQLNLSAGQRAKQSTAYDVAIEYFKVALDLLEEAAWSRHYDLTLTLHHDIATTCYVRGKFDVMETYLSAVFDHGKSLIDKIPAYEIKVQSHLAQSQLKKAVKTAIAVAKLLGINLTPQMNGFASQWESVKTKWHLGRRSPADLIHLPIMDNATIEAVVRILASANSAAYVGQPELLAPIVSKQVYLLAKYGNLPIAAFVYAWYGTLLCGRYLQIEIGSQFGQLALDTLKKFRDTGINAKTLFIVNCMIYHWTHHASETLMPLWKSYQNGREIGDVEYASWAILVRCEHLFFMGHSLTELEKELQFSEDAIRQFKQDSALFHNQIYHQSVLNLRQKSVSPHHLFGSKFDFDRLSSIQHQETERTGIFHAYLCQLLLCYLFEHVDQAVHYATLAEHYHHSAAGLLAIATFYLYDSLARLGRYPTCSPAEQHHILRKVDANQKKMKRWAHYAPDNHHHKFILVEAERYRIQGQSLKAIECYDEAIACAKTQGYENEEALANELAAKFYLDWGRTKIARTYMRDAHYCYNRWGAIAKVNDLETRYTELLSQTITKGGTTIMQTITAGSLIYTRSGLSLDLATIQKAYQALSREIVLERLLKTLIHLILENAGAQRGHLLLPHGEQLLVQASSEIDTRKSTVLESISMDDCSTVSTYIVNYVARTRKPIVFDNASTDPMVAHDAYVQEHHPHAVLCMPLLNQNQLQGVIYLENNLVVGAFTEDRVKILELLSGQAAIAIANAQLYTQLSHREQQLKQFLEAVPIGIGVLDQDGHPYYVNQRAKDLLKQGILPDVTAENVAREDNKYMAGTDTPYPRHRLPIVRALKGETSSVDDLEIHRDDGIISLESWGTPIYDERGNIQYALTAFQDITQRKQAEKLLADYNQTLEKQVAERTEELQQVNRELERLATLDGLTHIANRRSFDTYLFQAWQQQIETPQSLSLILLDIDYFKCYNDHYGHQAGDDCLVLVAQSIAQVVKRSKDLVARYGGEEFAIILPGTDLEGATSVAERVRAAILTLALPHQASKVSSIVTVSLGVSSIIPNIEQPLDDLIAHADEALYQAKAEGRNRVIQGRKE